MILNIIPTFGKQIKRRGKLPTTLCYLLFFISLTGWISAQQPVGGTPNKDKTKRDFDQDCMRSGCHGQLNETPWVHGPVAVGSCEICHKETDTKKHKFSLLRQKEKVCTFCHQGNVTGKVVHKIVLEKGCIKCHNPHGGMKRNLLKIQDEVKLCTECHKPEHYTLNPQFKLAKTAENKAKLLQTARVPLTKKVKKEDLRKFQFIHKPITEGKCLVCHDAHSSNHKGLIPVPERELCVTCHKGWGKIQKAGLKIHTPAQKNCLSCHMKHGGNVKKLLVRQPKDLCLSCHTHIDNFIKTGVVKEVKMVPIKAEGGRERAEAGEKKSNVGKTDKKTAVAKTVKESKTFKLNKPPTPKGGTPVAKNVDKKDAPVKTAAKAPVKVAMKATYVGEGQKLHKGIKDVKNCLLCHEHHAATSKQLVRSKIKKPCLSCHNKEIKSTDKRMIINVKKEIETAKTVHGPVADGKCLFCHRGHSSKHRSLLTQTHPEPLYAEYTRDSYKLCFQCHDTGLAEQKETLQTNFRDKLRNLHFVHIKDQGINTKKATGAKKTKGRTCNICHEMHAGPQKSLIKPDLPYGKGGWKLKIKFTPSKTGGSCLVACHKKKAYDNSKPKSSAEDSWKNLVKQKMKTNGLR